MTSSPRANLHVAGMLQFFFFITPFYSVLGSISVFMALSTVFCSLNSLVTLRFLTLFFRTYHTKSAPLPARPFRWQQQEESFAGQLEVFL